MNAGLFFQSFMSVFRLLTPTTTAISANTNSSLTFERLSGRIGYSGIDLNGYSCSASFGF